MTSSRTLPNKIKVATYSIALNEEKNVARWLKATAGSDVRVVMDTGSTDKTVELLEAAGVIVGHISVIPWRFDTARQAALDLVPDDVDVCLVLDMDEVPEPNFYKKVRKQWVEGSDRGWISIDTAFKWKIDRLHSRHGWKWRWPVHEVAVRIDGTENHKFCDTTAVISHRPDVTKSRSKYLPMLEAAVVEMPDDSRMWTYLCREYYYYENWEKVLESAEKVLTFDGLDLEMATACRWAADAARSLHKPSRPWFLRGIEICPDQGEPWLGLAADALRDREYDLALSAAIECFEKPVIVHYLHEPSAWLWKAYDIAAKSCYELGYLDEAITFANEASKAKGPEQERIERNLKFMKELKKNVSRTQSQNRKVLSQVS